MTPPTASLTIVPGGSGSIQTEDKETDLAVSKEKRASDEKLSKSCQ